VYKILVSDPLAPVGLDLLRQAPDLTFEAPGKMARADVLARIGEADALIVRSETQVDAELLGAAKCLRVVGRAGVGVDNIDVSAATARGVIVMNTPGANAMATAEHTMAMMLALCRKLPQADASLRRGEWNRSKFQGVQLYQKTLGVLGFGRIGRLVAQRAQGFGMDVLAYDPYVNEEVGRELGVRVVDLDELLARSDFLTLHTTLTPETRHLIDDAAIARMKSGARLINCARGELVEEAALVAALRSGKLAGAALDVFVTEPPTGSPLLSMDNVVVVPHLGASTAEAQRDVAVKIVEQVLGALRGTSFRNAINMPFVEGVDYERLRPYLALAERLGRLQAQLAGGRPQRLEVEARGADIGEALKPLTAALLKGLLAPQLGEEVNTINAPVLAAERGIVVAQSTGLESADYPNQLTCKLFTDHSAHTVAGGLLSNSQPRIVQIDAFRVDAPPTGVALVMLSHDVPGVVGRVGTLLGDRGVNIAEWRLGRDQPGGTALSFVNLDAELPAATLDELARLPEVLQARQVRLD
jgi:D-3-phosphoglycerate dehydrogenase